MNINFKYGLFSCVVLMLAGCAQLQVQDEDSNELAAAKVSGRILLGTCTLGISECGFYGLREQQRTEEAIMSWNGKHQSELIQQVGPPTRTSSDGKDGIVLVYDLSHTTSPQALTNLQGQIYYTPAQNITDVRMFFVNPQGIIYRCMWKH